MSIDVHAHCVPTRLLPALRNEGAALGVEIQEDGRGSTAVLAGRRIAGPIRTELMDPVLRLGTMDATGVEIQMLSSWIDLTGYELDPEAGGVYSRLFNEALAAEVATHPDRFMMLATVPLQEGHIAAAELEYAVASLGAVGVEIATTVDGAPLADASLEPFWAKAAELRCLVLVHPHQPLPGIDLSAHFLHNMVGRPAETTLAVARILVTGVLDRHPELRMCIVHGGGFLPYQVGRLQRGFDEKRSLMGGDMVRGPTELMRSLYFDTVLHSASSLRFLVDVVGADHVLLGTDYPFEMGDPDPVATVASIPGLSEDERRMILDGNARRLVDEIGERAGG